MEGQVTTLPAKFAKITQEGQNRVHASYEMALLLARNKKPYTDAEVIVKPALEIAARMLCNKDVAEKFKAIPLSNDTMTRRAEKLAENI